MKRFYTKIYTKFTPEYLKHMIFRDIIEEYNNLEYEGIIDFKFYDKYDIIDFFSSKLDIYMLL